MELFKNTASQKIRVFAFADAGHASLDAGEPVTGDAANITAQTAVDNAALGASNDTNPAEIDATNAPGHYEFDPTQAETNGNVIEWYAKSSTAGVQVVTVGGSSISTRPPNFPNIGIESDGHIHADLKEILGGTVATPSVTGVLEVDITHINGSAASVANEVDSNVTKWKGTAPASLADTDKVPSSVQHKNTTLDLTATEKASVNAEADTALTDYDPPTKAELDAAVSSLNDPTAASIADAVWDEMLSGHSTAGTTGKALTDALSQIDSGDLTAAAANKIADHLLRRAWSTAAASSDGDTKGIRSLLGAVAKLVNKIENSGGTLTIYEADDTTSLGTQSVTVNSSANPITALDTN